MWAMGKQGTGSKWCTDSLWFCSCLPSLVTFLIISVEVRGHLRGVSQPFLPPGGSWGKHSSHPAWWQLLYPDSSGPSSFMCAGTRGGWRATLGMSLNCSPPCLGRQCLPEAGACSCSCWPKRAPQMLMASPPHAAIIGHTSFQLSLWEPIVESSPQALRQALAHVYTLTVYMHA